MALVMHDQRAVHAEATGQGGLDQGPGPAIQLF